MIPLVAYYDFKTRNALGSHAGEEKLGGYYVTPACLLPNESGKLRNIFLGSLVYSKDMKQFRPKKCFRKTLRELKDLSINGLTWDVDGVKKQI